MTDIAGPRHRRGMGRRLMARATRCSPGRAPGAAAGVAGRGVAEEIGPVRGTRDGGGHAIRTGRAGPAARGLARAAMRLDAPALRDILEMTIADRGVIARLGRSHHAGADRRRRAIRRRPSGSSRSSTCSPAASPRCSRRWPARPAAKCPGSCSPPPTRSSTPCRWRRWLPPWRRAGVPSRLLGARVPPQALGRRGGPHRPGCGGDLVAAAAAPATPSQLAPPARRARTGRCWSRRPAPAGTPRNSPTG